jgi:hypothetical protein
MLHENWMKTGLAIVMATGIASAHLSEDGFKPAAGETVKVGSTYAITFRASVAHTGGTDIALSVDGGETWTDIKKDYKDASGLNTFNWTVAGSASTTAKIRICQHGGLPANPCTNSDKTNSLNATNKDGNYVMVGKAFTISGTTALRPITSASNPFSVDFRPESRNVNVSFGLAEGEDVLLQAFDHQGRLLATLVQGAFKAGSHRLSLAAKGLDASGGTLVFKLKIGDQVQSHTWTQAR